MKFFLDGHNLIINDVPWKPSYLFPNAVLSPDDIENVINGYLSPSIKTKAGEILIFDYSKNESMILENYAKENEIALIDYVDVWSLILEEFLDTEIDEEANNRIFSILAQCRIEKEETQKIRLELKEMMLDYNFASGLWEWANLGMNDLLNACKGTLNRNIRMTSEYFEKYYWEVMRIQELGRNKRLTIAST